MGSLRAAPDDGQHRQLLCAAPTGLALLPPSKFLAVRGQTDDASIHRRTTQLNVRFISDFRDKTNEKKVFLFHSKGGEAVAPERGSDVAQTAATVLCRQQQRGLVARQEVVLRGSETAQKDIAAARALTA